MLTLWQCQPHWNTVFWEKITFLSGINLTNRYFINNLYIVIRFKKFSYILANENLGALSWHRLSCYWISHTGGENSVKVIIQMLKELGTELGLLKHIWHLPTWHKGMEPSFPSHLQTAPWISKTIGNPPLEMVPQIIWFSSFTSSTPKTNLLVAKIKTLRMKQRQKISVLKDLMHLKKVKVPSGILKYNCIITAFCRIFPVNIFSQFWNACLCNL